MAELKQTQNKLLKVGRHVVVQFVEALRYKPEGHGFHYRWRHCNFLLTQPFWPHYGPGDKSSRCIGLTTLPPSCADCLVIWESQPPGTLRACPGL
jgi:hypothetical protein